MDICNHFSSYFSILIADTPELKQEVYKIRYQVYCEELNYEPKENFPDGMERDVYDSRSIHCLLKHKSSGLYAGCVRFVLPELENLQTVFPLEKTCNHNINFNELDRSHFGEISRLAVTADFRKRKGEKETATGLIFTEDEQNTAAAGKRRFPVIALSLYLASINMLVEFNMDGLTMMERRLARHLRRFGITSHVVGDEVEHRGKRSPFRLLGREIVNNMDENTLSLFKSISSELKTPINLHPLYETYSNLLSVS